MCQKEAVRKRGPLPIPRGYDAMWQDTMCIPINRDVRVGNERVTAFEQLLNAALEPDACKAEGACRRAGGRPPSKKKAVKSIKIAIPVTSPFLTGENCLEPHPSRPSDGVVQRIDEHQCLPGRAPVAGRNAGRR